MSSSNASGSRDAALLLLRLGVSGQNKPSSTHLVHPSKLVKAPTPTHLQEHSSRPVKSPTLTSSKSIAPTPFISKTPTVRYQLLYPSLTCYGYHNLEHDNAWLAKRVYLMKVQQFQTMIDRLRTKHLQKKLVRNFRTKQNSYLLWPSLYTQRKSRHPALTPMHFNYLNTLPILNFRIVPMNPRSRRSAIHYKYGVRVCNGMQPYYYQYAPYYMMRYPWPYLFLLVINKFAESLLSVMSVSHFVHDDIMRCAFSHCSNCEKRCVFVDTYI